MNQWNDRYYFNDNSSKGRLVDEMNGKTKIYFDTKDNSLKEENTYSSRSGSKWGQKYKNSYTSDTIDRFIYAGIGSYDKERRKVIVDMVKEKFFNK